MNPLRKKITIAIIPIMAVAWGIFMLSFFDPFYSKSIDPEFPYLVNGLNCATLNFNYIGHYDHPGTPFQVFNGIVIRITHLFTGKADIVQDVFARPEHYMNAISTFLFLIMAGLIYAVGLIGFKRKIPFWQILFLQASFLLNDVLLWLFSRVNPDYFFMITGLIFVLVYLQHGYENRSPRKFALWSGVVMALGLATKFNFIPLLILPLLLIDTNKNRLIYAGSGIVSFFIFISPIINKFDDFFRFMKSIFKHDGLYGGGESKMMNFEKMIDSSLEIFKINPELLLLLVVLVGLTVLAFRKRKEGNGFVFLFSGYLFMIFLQILMVSKHFKNYYLAPVFILYGFIFFTISLFLATFIKKKSHLILASSLLPLLFILITIVKVKRDLPEIAKIIEHREKIRLFVDTEISKSDYWFVEPTWEGGPHVENAIVYGLSYCGHRDEYIPQLKAVNPNVITYEGNNQVKLWRGAPASLDSMVATGKNIYIYSTPWRQAQVLVQMVQESAVRNQYPLTQDTVYADTETQDRIIRLKASGSSTGERPQYDPAKAREIKIEGFIHSIKNTPEWLELVRIKALEKNISLDSMILLDAIYMADEIK